MDELRFSAIRGGDSRHALATCEATESSRADLESSFPVDPRGERSLRPLTDQEFILFRDLIHKKAGIWLRETKKALLFGRLHKRIRDLGMPSFYTYYKFVTSDESNQELFHLLDFISTNKTDFFREVHHFEYLERNVFPALKKDAEQGKRRKRIRVWSAACSTGEEPYSLAMLLLKHFPLGCGWDVEILASDISTRVLRQAYDGVWPIEDAQDIPEEFLKEFMLKGIGKSRKIMRAGDALRSILEFERINLIGESYPVSGEFDLIFCRNVLIYFDSETKIRVIEQLCQHLTEDGHFFVGHAEGLYQLNQDLKPVATTIYVPNKASSKSLFFKRGDDA